MLVNLGLDAVHWKSFWQNDVSSDKVRWQTAYYFKMLSIVFLNVPSRPLFHPISFFSNSIHNKTVVISRIRTRIVWVEGEHADHLTTITAHGFSIVSKASKIKESENSEKGLPEDVDGKVEPALEQVDRREDACFRFPVLYFRLEISVPIVLDVYSSRGLVLRSGNDHLILFKYTLPWLQCLAYWNPVDPVKLDQIGLVWILKLSVKDFSVWRVQNDPAVVQPDGTHRSSNVDPWQKLHMLHIPNDDPVAAEVWTPG